MFRSFGFAAAALALSAFAVEAAQDNASQISSAQANPAQDDFESKLFTKFQKNNYDAARKLARDVETQLASASAAAPEKAVGLLSVAKDLLLEDRALSKEERESLLRRVNDQLRL